jgi:succinoglycan biosynthesis protein ExoA
MSSNAQTASVIIPTLDEIGPIGPLLDQLLAEPDDVVGEVLVADGGSTDGTREIVSAAARSDPRVQLIDNPDRIQAAGINRAFARANPRFGVIVRVDAHAGYPKGYVGRVGRAMAITGADSAVVRMETIGESCLQRAIALASNSRIGTGGSAHRMGHISGFIDHGHHAGMTRAVFERTGGYDPTFEANEDAELDYRIRHSGGRIWFAANISIRYTPRRTLKGLARQYFRYGSGRARTFLKHREPLRIRQMLPPIALTGVVGGMLLAPLNSACLVLPIGYGAIVSIAAAATAMRTRSACALLMAPALATMHFAWGSGFLHRLYVHMRTQRDRKVGIDVENRRMPTHSEDPA